MDQLRDSFSKLVEETLAMEDPRLSKIKQRQPYSNNDEDNITETTTTEELEKSQDFSQQKTKLSIDIKLDVLPLG